MATSSAPVTNRRLNRISLVLVLGAITTLLDTTIVNIALDHLHTTFGASVGQTWPRSSARSSAGRSSAL
jgi:hypothetical protein